MLPSPELVLAVFLLVVLAAAPVAARFPGALVSQLEEAVQARLLVLVQVQAQAQVPGLVRNPQVPVRVRARVPAHSPPARELVLVLVPVHTLVLPFLCTCLS